MVDVDGGRVSDYAEDDADLDTLAALRAANPHYRDPAVAKRARDMRADALRVRARSTNPEQIAAIDELLARLARLEAITGDGSS